MTTGDKVFLDTNVLLRANHAGLGLHHEANDLLLQWKQDNVELWISRQIIREYLVQITRPGLLAEPLTAAQVEAQVKGLRKAFQIADETDAVTDKLVGLLQTFPSGGKQIHDVNVIATMLVYNIGTLATTNFEDMKRFAGRVKIVHLSAES